jgi:glutaredoxin
MDDRWLARCACGWETTGPSETIVAATIEHAQRIHNMPATRDGVMAQAIDITWLIDLDRTNVYGVDTCEDTTRAREYFTAAGHAFRYINLEAEPTTRDRLHAMAYRKTPVVVTARGDIHVEPEDEALAGIVASSATGREVEA